MRLLWICFATGAWSGYSRVQAELGDAIDGLDDDRVQLVEDTKGWDYDYLMYAATPTVYMIGKPPRKREDVGILTMYDANRIPERWVEILNYATWVWVPSTWCKQVFRESGVEVPIVVSKLGVDVEKFAYVNRNLDLPFTVLTSSLQTFPHMDRKNTLDVVKAWRMAELHEKDDAKLVVKASTGVTGLTMRNARNVIYIQRILEDDEWTNLMQAANLYVCASSGEGFGLPPLEAMSTGAAVVATEWGGMLDWMDGSPVLPLPTLGLEPARHYNKTYGGDAQWVVTDWDHLADLLLWAYEHRQQVSELGTQGAEFVRDNWTWEHAAKDAVRSLCQTLN